MTDPAPEPTTPLPHDAPPVDPVPLAADFPDADRDEWLSAVYRVLLRGRPDATTEDAERAFARRLVTHTEDGFDLQPLYAAEDAPDAPPAPPGSAPYTRSTHVAPRDWEIRQRVWPDVDGSTGVGELESGATGLLVELPADDPDAALDRSLDGVHLDLVPVSVSAPGGDPGFAAATALLDAWADRSIAPDARTGTLGIDPIGAWLRAGGTTDVRADLARSAELVATATAAAPAARAVVADGALWHDAGASDAQELAWALSAAVATVRVLADAGLDAGAVAGSIEFRWAASADQFATITKLRAARSLWARVAEVAGLPETAARMFQHADGSRAMLTRHDPWVNSLRTTVACFAAAVGGADAITTSPHDLLHTRGGSALGRRVARNTQSILLLESNLARVVDLAGGSWYVEARTEAVADAAWSELRRIESLGGIVAAVERGAVHDALTRVRAARAEAIATRARPLTGVTEFPDATEDPPPPPPPEPDVGDTPFEPLRPVRLADAVERQRDRTDATVRAGSPRPVVYLATLGGPAAATQRATFAKNFFAVAGIDTVEGPVDRYDAAHTDLVCLCSTDDVYRSDGAAAVEALRAAGAATVYLAGRRLDIPGVDTEIGLGTDVLDVLSTTLDQLGVPA